jgi:YVTN family beta-propeller protein
MRCAQRATMLIAVAITGLALAAPTTAAAAPASSVRGTAQAAKGCITVRATIPVGRFPFGVAADPKTNTIYVANDVSSGTVSVISGRTNTVTATIPVGSDPDGVAADPKAKAVYVANALSDTVSVLAACSK